MTTTLPFQKPAEIDSRRVKLSLIDIPLEYEGKESLVEDDALRKSIEKEGVHQSVIVMRQSDEAGTQEARRRFTLIKGGRRVRISEAIGLDDVPAIVVLPPPDADPKAFRDRLRMILTQARQDLLPSQRAELIRQLMKVYGLNQKEIAAALGFDAGSITNWLSIEHYDRRIVKLIDSGAITMHSARAFDGMKPAAQRAVLKRERKALRSMSGGQFHRHVRTKYDPQKRPSLYVAPEKTAEKMSRTAKGRKSKARPRLGRDEKKRLARDLGLREVELEDSKEELQRLKREITAATQPIRAILRSRDLMNLVSGEMREELDRFAEIYV